jgi:hypothetical protein
MSILIVSFNENNNFFIKKDCQELITRIKEYNPLCLIICTQKSTQSILGIKSHFQHVLKEALKDEYELLSKYDLSNIKKYKFGTTSRTRIYINIKKNNKPYSFEVTNKNIDIDNLKLKKDEYITKTEINLLNKNNNNHKIIKKINIFNLDIDLTNKNIDKKIYDELLNKTKNSSTCNTFFCRRDLEFNIDKNNCKNIILHTLNSNFYKNEDNKNKYYLLNFQLDTKGNSNKSSIPSKIITNSTITNNSNKSSIPSKIITNSTITNNSNKSKQISLSNLSKKPNYIPPPPPPRNSQKSSEIILNNKYNRYKKMQKVGLSSNTIEHKMKTNGLSENNIKNFLSNKSSIIPPPPPSLKNNNKYITYKKMLYTGVPNNGVKQKMKKDGLSENNIKIFFKKNEEIKKINGIPNKYYNERKEGKYGFKYYTNELTKLGINKNKINKFLNDTSTPSKELKSQLKIIPKAISKNKTQIETTKKNSLINALKERRLKINSNNDNNSTNKESNNNQENKIIYKSLNNKNINATIINNSNPLHVKAKKNNGSFVYLIKKENKYIEKSLPPPSMSPQSKSIVFNTKLINKARVLQKKEEKVNNDNDSNSEWNNSN